MTTPTDPAPQYWHEDEPAGCLTVLGRLAVVLASAAIALATVAAGFYAIHHWLNG